MFQRTDRGFPSVAATAARLKGAVLLASLGLIASCGGESDSPPPSRDGVEALAAQSPVITEGGDLRAAVAPGQRGLVSVRKRKFADLGALTRFAIDEMGGKPIYNAAGELVGAQGVSVASGDISYRDEETGQSFKSTDLAQAFLGGSAGSIDVAGKTFSINAAEGSPGDLLRTSAALTSDSSSCVGGDCISGHSWKSDYVLYHSVGSETQQQSGGYGTITYACCSSGGTLVYYQGRNQCRYVTEWEPADPEHGIYRPTPIGYGYRAAQTCSTTTTVNTLSLSVTAILPSGFVGNTTSRSEANTRDVTLSNWAVGVGVSFLGIDDVAGVCGLHTGSRGGTSRTRAGNATDLQCNPNQALTAATSAVGNPATAQLSN